MPDKPRILQLGENMISCCAQHGDGWAAEVLAQLLKRLFIMFDVMHASREV
jgi:hypothetical protein